MSRAPSADPARAVRRVTTVQPLEWYGPSAGGFFSVLSEFLPSTYLSLPLRQGALISSLRAPCTYLFLRTRTNTAVSFARPVYYYFVLPFDAFRSSYIGHIYSVAVVVPVKCRWSQPVPPTIRRVPALYGIRPLPALIGTRFEKPPIMFQPDLRFELHSNSSEGMLPSSCSR